MANDLLHALKSQLGNNYFKLPALLNPPGNGVNTNKQPLDAYSDVPKNHRQRKFFGVPVGKLGRP